MAKISFNDIVALAKSGYTPAAIKELMEMDVKDPEPEKVTEPEKKTDPEDTTDYKALYEQTKKDLDDLKAANTTDNIAPEPIVVDEIIKDIKSRLY